MFNSTEEGIHWIQTQVKFRPKTSLEHVKRAFEMLSLDLTNMKKIHVTGTNGKGSVCMFTTTVLVDAGYKVGTYTSPYLVNFNERIKLNGIDIKDDDLLKHINRIYLLNQTYAQNFNESLSFFELLTLVALSYFEAESCDVIVMEVGIGGLLDATNILNYDVSAITNIGFDHMKQLGHTLESIAYNKLGILKSGNHLVTAVNQELWSYFNEISKQFGASIHIIDTDQIQTLSEYPHWISYLNHNYKLSLIGNFQKCNAALSVEIVKYLYPNLSDNQISDSFSHTSHPGRMETVLDGVVIDGGHNIHAINAIIYTLHSTFKMYNIHVLFSALSDKEPLKMLNALKPHVASITTTAFPDARYESLQILPFDFENNPKTALQNLIKTRKENELILITGSLHFIGYMKKEIIPYLK